MKAIYFALISLAAVVLSFSQMTAQERDPREICGDIIAQALLARKIEKRDDNTERGERYFMCSLSNSAVRTLTKTMESEAGGGGGSFEIPGLFSIDGKGEGSTSAGLTDDRINKWKAQKCEETSKAVNQSSAVYALSEQLTPEQVKAWEACIVASTPTIVNDLKCFADPSRTEIAFRANWRSNVGLNPTIDSIFISRDGKREDIKTSNGELRAGNNLFVVPRVGVGDHLFALTAHSAGSTFDCTVLVPGKIEPELSEENFGPIVGNWCGDESNGKLLVGNLRDFAIRDGGDRVIFKYRPIARYYLPARAGTPEYVPYEKKERGPEQEARYPFTTVRPGLIGAVEPIGLWENNHDYDYTTKKWHILPTNGKYIRYIQLIRKQGPELWWFRIRMLTDSEDARIPVDVPDIEEKMRATDPLIFRAC
ncbi:hypothetical protein [Rhizobium leguminosarum]|uniref:hypothetical protein n=1 Tax=Rhizobium leguminosarum TaxID=384 RepID=UPI003F9C8772